MSKKFEGWLVRHTRLMMDIFRALNWAFMGQRCIQLHMLHSQLLNIIILKYTSPVLLNQLGKIFQYWSSSTKSLAIFSSTLPVELGVW